MLAVKTTWVTGRNTKTYSSRLTITEQKKLMILKCNNLSTFALKNNENFADYNLEKLCPWPWNFLESLVLALNVVSSTPPLAFTT